MVTSTPRCSSPTRTWRTRLAGSFRTILTLFLLFFIMQGSKAQSFGTDFSQSSNANGNPKGYVVWIGSIIQQSNSVFHEGQSILQRAFFMNIPVASTGQYKLMFSHQATKGGIHAYDFVTGWPKGIARSNIIDPGTYSTLNSCANLGPKVSSAQCSQFDAAVSNPAAIVPASAYVTTANGDNVAQRVAQYDLINGADSRVVDVRAIDASGNSITLNNVRLEFTGYDSGSDQYAYYELRWDGPKSGQPYNVLVMMAGHLAVTGDGTGLSYLPPNGGSANISGGPYHFKLSNIVLNNNSTAGQSGTSSNNVSLGSQDNQIKGADILLPAPVCNVTPSTQSRCTNGTGNFTYTANVTNPSTPTYNWSIVNSGGTNASISSGQGTNTFVVNPGTVAGTFTVNLLVTNSDGQTSTCSATGTLTAPPSCTITETPTHQNCPGGSNSYSVPDAGANATYQWVVTGNATIASGQGTRTLTVTNGTCGTYNVAVTVTDGSSNACASSCNQTYSVVDVTPPTFTGSYTAVTLGCNPSGAAIEAALASATATDNCGTPTVTTLSTGSPSTVNCTTSQVRTFQAVDGCGNISTISRTVSWTTDTQAPTFTGSYTAVTLGCNPSAAAIEGALDGATATDNCGTPTVTTLSTGSPQTVNCTTTQVRTFRAIDGCGNTSTISRSVSWTTDTQAPTFTGGNYGTVTLGCNPTGAAIESALDGATATDNCGSPTVTTLSTGSPSTVNCTTTQTRTFSAVDGCGNTATISRTVSWTTDTQAPSFTGSYTNVTLGCNPTGAAIEAALASATATDNCGTPTVTTLSTGSPSTTNCTTSQVRTFRAVDGCGNTSTVSRTVSWTTDTQAPTFTGSYANVTLGCNPSGAAIEAALASATATDNCGTPTVSTLSTGSANTVNCTTTQTRTFSAIDGCGNTSTISRTVSWTTDTQAPTFTGGNYGNVTLGCNPSGAAIEAALDGATATDNCGTPTVTTLSTSNPNTVNCTTTQVRTFSAVDGCGNTSTISRTVSWTTDTQAPTFTGSYANVTLGCNPSAAAIEAALASATATDNCGTPTVTTLSTGNPSTVNCTTSQVRTFRAVDACGNTSSVSRTVSWTTDTQAPTFTGSYTAVTLGCNPTGAAIEAALDGATATDNCGTPTVTTLSTGSPSTVNCTTTQVRTFSAVDGCGNTATISRSVSWTTDTQAPTFTGSYTTVTLGCNPTGAAIEAALASATATDNCGTPTVSTLSTGSANTVNCTTTQVRTFSAVDGCGNTSTISRTVSWTTDTQAPTFTGSYTAVTLGCNPTGAAIEGALDGATATDNCGTPTVTTLSTGNPNTVNCTTTQVRTFQAVDGCGNTATISRSVSWTTDTQAPVFTGGNYGNVTLGCNPTGAAIEAALDGATATDNCGTPTVTTLSTSTPSTVNCTTTSVRTFRAIDGCGNTSTISRTVSWTTDTQAPTFTGSYTTVTLGCNPTGAAIEAALDGASATDNCGTPTVTTLSTGNPSTVNCTTTQVRTFSAVDGCGNTSTISRTVSWTSDTQAPTFTGGNYGNVTLGCNPTGAAIEAALDGATATDNCGTPTVTTLSTSGPSTVNCTTTSVRTFRAVDGCGNTATISRTVSWTTDTQAPVFTGGNYSNVTLGCNPTGSAIEAALDGATATDNCGTPTVTTLSTSSPQTVNCTTTSVRTFRAVDGCGNTSTISRTVSWTTDTQAPVFTSTPSSTDIACDADLPALVTPTASDNCGTPTVSTLSISDVTADCATGFKRVIVRTWVATDACGNTSTASQTIRVRCCEVFCTYTQGYYGGKTGNGQACNGTSTTPVLTTITNAINSNSSPISAASTVPPAVVYGGSPLIIGRVGGATITITSSPSDVQTLNVVLPGGGNAKALTHSGNISIQDLGANGYLKNGRINNNLLSQTITLGLNLGVKAGLGNLAIQPDKYLVTANVVACGSTTIADCKWTWNSTTMQWVLSSTPYHVSAKISQAIYDALPTKNIVGLYSLANSALGGSALPPNVGYTDILNAVDMINNAFDGCAMFIRWSSTTDVSDLCTPPAITSIGNIAPESVTVSNNIKVSAFPNPFNDLVKFTIESNVSGQAQLEVFNLLGQKVNTIYNGYIQANKSQIVDYKVPPKAQQNLIYVLRIGGKQVTGKLLNVRQ